MAVVQMKVQISGTRNGDAWPAVGESIDVEAAEAAQLIASGLAVEPEVEVETADKPTGRGRK